MEMRKILLLIFVLVSLYGCIPGTGETNSNLKPKASSEPGEIILVMDSLHWDSKLGKEIKKTFQQLTPGLPRPEPLFTVRYIRPNDFRSILKYAQNIIIVSVLENYSSGSERTKRFFTQGSLKQINDDTTKFLYTKKEEWARGQEVMYLFGKTEDILSHHIRDNRSKLQDHFNNIERKRTVSGLYKAKELKEVRNMLLRNHNFSIRIPFGWRIDFEEKSKNFIWLRNPGLVVDKNLWIYYTDYTDEKVFDDVTALRNAVTKEYIYDDKEANDTSYVVVETLVPPIIKRTIFNNNFAIEVRGLWKTNNLSMGGPFLSYVFVDESINRLYYIDGFVYSPSKPQREYIRELETILKTFRVEEKAGTSQ